MSEIIVGYDGSECSKAALEVACEMANAPPMRCSRRPRRVMPG
ncbi:MAG: hypothetical protein ACRDLL_07960 [Solirubrobacterales bacterium]